jgi:hypothetical protein
VEVRREKRKGGREECTICTVYIPSIYGVWARTFTHGRISASVPICARIYDIRDPDSVFMVHYALLAIRSSE